MTTAGDTLALEEVVALAEAVTEKKFEVTQLSATQVEGQKSSLEMPRDILKDMWLDMKLLCLRNPKDGFVLKPVVNRMCLNVEPTDVQRYLADVWAT